LEKLGVDVFKRATLLAVTLSVVVATACGGQSPAPPEVQVDRTACTNCRMLISEPRFAAAYQVQEGGSKVFDDIGCLLEAMRGEKSAVLHYWFRDAAGGEWIEGNNAVFVTGSRIRTPMNGGVVAYRDRATADDAAAREGGRVIGSVAELLGPKKEGS
jgi:copper chaperone NosL